MDDSHVDPKKSDTRKSILYDSIYIYFKTRENRTTVLKSMRLDGKAIEKNKDVVIIQLRVVLP